MLWSVEDEEEEDLLFSPALMARRASESWINTPPIEVNIMSQKPFCYLEFILLTLFVLNKNGFCSQN